MYLFLQSWWVILQMSSPAILLMLLTIWRVRKSNPLGYQMGWAHFFIFILYSLAFGRFHQSDPMKPGDTMGEFAVEMAMLLIITPAHLLIYWISLLMVKPNTIPQPVYKTSTLKDPILDEQPPTK
jgi:hypothetical protein